MFDNTFQLPQVSAPLALMIAQKLWHRIPWYPCWQAENPLFAHPEWPQFKREIEPLLHVSEDHQLRLLEPDKFRELAAQLTDWAPNKKQKFRYFEVFMIYSNSM